MAEHEQRLKFMASELLYEGQPEEPKSDVVSRIGMKGWGLDDIPTEIPLALSRMTGFSYYSSGRTEKIEKHTALQQEPPREKYF